LGAKKQLWDVLPRLKEITNKKFRQAKKLKVDINDLFVKFHVKDGIKIPIPNLHAEDRLRFYFGHLENIDYHENIQIGVILYVLENQHTGNLADMSKEDLHKAGIKRSQDIQLYDKERYIKAIYEMFMALKKNSIRHQKTILEGVLQMLDQDTTGEKQPSTV